MPSLLTIETGAGVANANSYIDALDAGTYLMTYEPTAYTATWPVGTSDQEGALLIGCQALELNYRDKWLSSRRIPIANNLSWPRYFFYSRETILIDENTIPVALQQAQTTLALYYLQGIDVFPQEPKDRFITEQTNRVGDLATTTRYIPGSPYEVFRKLDRLLWAITRSSQVTALLR